MKRIILLQRSNFTKPLRFSKVFLVQVFLVPLLLLMTLSARAQPHNELGRPFITVHNQLQQGGTILVWSFAQDERGVMYMGNGPGILEYDGSSWRVIETANKSFGRSLAMDQNGRIYVGASAEFGYLAADSIGQMQYVSLLEHVKQEHRDFGFVWTTHVTKDGIYFQTLERLFRLTPPDFPSANREDREGRSWQVKVWEPRVQFNFSFSLDNTLYVHQGGVGLMEMVGDSLSLLPGSEQFANERLQVMLPFTSGKEKNETGKILLGTFNRGLFLYDGRAFRPFRTEADAILRSKTLYKGLVLPDGTFGFAMLDGGFVNIDKRGKLLQYLDQATGLPSDGVLSLFVDRQGMLWLGLEDRICQVEIHSPLSLYDHTLGLTGSIYDMIRHRGTLYVATAGGVVYLEAQSSRFKPVSGITAGNPQSFAFLTVGDDLYAAIGSGIHRIEGSRATAVKKAAGLSFAPTVLHLSRQNKKRMFVGLYNGLASLRLDGGSRKWLDEGKIEGFSAFTNNIEEEEPGVLWLGTADHGAVRVTFTDSSLKNPRIQSFDHQHGLPTDGGVSVYSVSGRMVFATRQGVFRFDKNSQAFLPDSILNVAAFGATRGSGSVAQDNHGNIWLSFGRESAVLRRQLDGTYLTEKTPFLRFSDLPATDIYPEQDDVVWFGSIGTLIRYDPNIEKDYAIDYPALIRRVIAGKGALVFGGADPEDSFNSLDDGVQFDHQDNALRFEFAATSYDNPSENRFRTILEGFDDQWSAWSKENKRDYTNLPPGDYRFRVRAKNIYEHESREAAYGFTILPPWWRTWWAYGGYALMFGLLLFGADRVQRRRLIKRERERAEFREAKLHAEAENERRKNVELLSEIGKDITGSLDMDTIFSRLYEHVNQLADATIFGVGIYHPEKEEIEYRLAIENGRKYEPYTRDARNKNQFPVWCIDHRKPVFINDVDKEFRNYLKDYKTDSDSGRKLQGGVVSGVPRSLIYLPLITKERVIGVITMQSYEKHAYTDYHLNLLQNLATYTTIAFDNAEAYTKLNRTLETLKSAQQQLVTQEKLASLGALTAGIAHEIKNPLNFVNNFAELSNELIDDLRDELEKNGDTVSEEAAENIRVILTDLEQNSKKINEHGKRADSIVKSMLQHSRGTSGERQETDLNAMLEEDLNLAYHGMRAQDSSFNIRIEKEFDDSIGKLTVVPQDVSRVFLNIISNGFYAAHQKKNTPFKSQGDGAFSPTLRVRTRDLGDKVEVRIRDNGNGIPEEIRDKLFNPFFTTKPAGQGTGLGLSISHDIIVQEHKGEIKVETEEGRFTEFVVCLPRNG